MQLLALNSARVMSVHDGFKLFFETTPQSTLDFVTHLYAPDGFIEGLEFGYSSPFRGTDLQQPEVSSKPTSSANSEKPKASLFTHSTYLVKYARESGR